MAKLERNLPAGKQVRPRRFWAGKRLTQDELNN